MLNIFITLLKPLCQTLSEVFLKVMGVVIEVLLILKILFYQDVTVKDRFNCSSAVVLMHFFNHFQHDFGWMAD